MSTQAPGRTSLPESWPDFLGKIQKTLEEAAQATQARANDPPIPIAKKLVIRCTYRHLSSAYLARAAMAWSLR